MQPMDGNNEQTGAAGPQANALTHGLTATKCLPLILRAERLPELIASLQVEYCPCTITGELLIREVARHAAALEVTEQAEPAVWRTAAQALAELASQQQSDDLQLSAAVTAEPLERAARYRRMHEKALHQALDKLRNLQAAGAVTPRAAAPTASEQFGTEAGCEEYLRQRFFSKTWRCPQCRQPRGHWLATRRRWQCAHCSAQIGLRHGTVFERSPLPLTVWIAAIRAFAARTTLTVRELMAVTGISRPATARTMLERIRRAVDNHDLIVGLVGLIAFPLDCADLKDA